MPEIHSSAVVEPGAKLGSGVYVGPFCTVGADVTLGDRVRLISHVALEGVTEIGEDTVISPFAHLGGAPQHLAHKGEPTRLVIGPRNRIRAHVTMDTGTVIPFGSVWGNHAHLEGLNLVGLKRRGFPRETINDLRSAYRLLFADEGTFQERLEDTARVFSSSQAVMDIVEFIRSEANRPICLPAREL